MTLPTFDTLDAIPEPFRAIYAEKDGKFVANVPTADDITKLSRTVEALRDGERDAKKRANEAERERDAIKREADGRGAGADDKKLSELLDKWKADTEAAVAPERDARTKAETRLRQVLLIDEVKRQALAAGVLGTELDDYMALVHDDERRRRFDLADDERAIVLDDAGQPTTLTPLEWHATQKARYPWAFAAPVASGSGASAGSGAPAATARMGSSPYTREAWAKLGPMERMDALAKYPDIEKKAA